MKISPRLWPAVVLLVSALPVPAQSPPPPAQIPTLPAPALNSPAPPAVNPYVLGVDDQIAVTVLGQENLNSVVTILSDGTITLPVVGRIHADGMTAEQLRKTITVGMKRYVLRPQVSVSVKQGAPRLVTVAGAARSPGSFAYRVGMRLVEAIATGGGPAQPPELTQATLISDGGAKVTPIDISKLLDGKDASQNVPLAPGDTILMLARDVATAEVQVAGEVNRPGTVMVPAEGTNLQAVLTQSGGTTPRAALTRAILTHAGEVKTIDLYPLVNGQDDAIGKTKLVAGDSLYLPENKNKITVVGEVKSVGQYLIPEGDPLTTTTALALAGGTTRDGDNKHVSIVRRGADGQPHLVDVNTNDVLKGKNAVANASLEPNDILYVPRRRQSVSLGQVLGAVSSAVFLRGVFK